MESLQDWGLLGEFYIGYGFIRGRFAGIYYDILGAGLWSPKGVAESPEGDSLHAYPARGYFSVKKSNQKSLGEDPETPTRRYTPPGNAAQSRSGIRRRL